MHPSIGKVADIAPQVHTPARSPQRHLVGPSALLAVVGIVAMAVVFALDGHAADGAVRQDWPPFVLVAGLLLVGAVAEGGGLFASAGRRLVSSTSEVVRPVLAVAIVAVTSALLNLDTAAAFLTPVLVYAARHEGRSELRYLYLCLLVTNAASTLLPGSNLTNLIVLSGHRLTGGAMFLEMAPAWAAGVAITAAVVLLAERRTPPPSEEESRDPAESSSARRSGGWWLGLVAVLGAATLVVALASPALFVLVLGVVAVGAFATTYRRFPERLGETLGLPTLVGLFGIAVALGTLGRSWSGPATLLGHLDLFGTAAVGAVATVVVNNLPAASLLSARLVPHPLALLVGLDLGPNLFITGSLAWLLWRRSARLVGAEPSIAHASRLGLWSVPPAIAAAVALLVVGR